jgi:hypothetical protein
MCGNLLMLHFENFNFRCNNYKYIFYNMMQMKKLIVGALFLMLLAANAPAQEKIEKWGVFELTLKGPSTGNPFMGKVADGAKVKDNGRHELE